ncbi:copper resistance protein CopC [Effusibacillus consociatus]|uniref:Copper resistance protein CopC n=1 Tax=Effusibacillus consociatus TaxID=1117041 RepID=A0ABV9Q4U7_9BACL
MLRFTTRWISFILVFCLLTAVASAHANLLTMSPGSGEIVNKNPDRITLTFSEPLELEAVELKVKDWKGHPIPLSDLKLTPGNTKQISAALPDLPEGTYTVHWSVLSEDGHPVTDSYSFSIGKETPVDQLPTKDASGGLSDSLIIILRYLVEGILLLGGGLYWISLLAEKRGFSGWEQILKRGSGMGLGTLAIGTIALWFCYTASLPESFFSSIFQKGNWSLLSQIPFVGMLAVHSLLLLLLAVPQMGASWYLLIWALLIGSLAFGGHAWGIEPRWLSLTSRMLHVFALAAWLGSLSYLGLALYWEKHNKKQIDRLRLRPFFVRIAMASAGLTMISGIVMVTIQTGWEAVLGASLTWSVLLWLKIGLLLFMLILAFQHTLQWKRDGQAVSQALLRWEWIAGILAVLAGIWMSQSNYPIP